MKYKHLQPFLILAMISAFSLGSYILVSYFVFRIGFPLDDAWIHQTYARNLAQLGEWSFIPGQPSAGSTAPLWSVFLSIGYLWGNKPIIFTFFLGWVCLLGTALTGMWAFRLLCPQRKKVAFWIGIFLLFEWHLVWAAGSGMETLLFTLIILMVLGWLLKRDKNWLGIGVLIGLSIWVRPGGITLIIPAILTLFFVENDWMKRLRAVLYLALGFLALVLPYIISNYMLSGTLWPNTYFAKQTEYALHRQIPLWRRILSLSSLPLVGAGAVLLPGFIIYLSRAVRKQAWGALAAAVWFLGYIMIYAIRLPVTYQHGRYIIPAMPIYFIWSFAGMLGWLQIASPSFWLRISSRVWLIVTALVLLAFWFMGARAYARDVAVIETEMVTTAQWVSENLEPEVNIAAHDIGALGYFGGHQILDLAGLISPDVIPFIRDETRLKRYLNNQEVDYLITFPGWYPNLVQDLDLIYTTNGTFSMEMGGENMAVYQWKIP